MGIIFFPHNIAKASIQAILPIGLLSFVYSLSSQKIPTYDEIKSFL